MTQPKPCTLYRFYAADGALLYIGIADNWPSRLREHQRTQVWWGDVANVATLQFATRAEALIAEAHAIRSERPRHNVVHQEKPGKTASSPRVFHAHELVWKCSGCHEQILPLADGYLQSPAREMWRHREEMKEWWAQVEAQRAAHGDTLTGWIPTSLLLNHPEPIPWIITCKACDPDPDGEPYWIGLEHVATWPALARTIAHLMEKDWFHDSDFDTVLHRIAGWNPAQGPAG